MVLDWIIEHDEVTLLACNEKWKLIKSIQQLGIDIVAIDFDPKFKYTPDYICKDFIFDDIEIKGLAVNYNCEKTYPLGQVFSGKMILIGDNDSHNGDCNPIDSLELLKSQNLITNVYEELIVDKHFIVYGSNDNSIL